MITRRRAIYFKGKLPLGTPLKTNVHTQLAGLGTILGHTIKFHSDFTFIMLRRDLERDCSSEPMNSQMSNTQGVVSQSPEPQALDKSVSQYERKTNIFE